MVPGSCQRRDDYYHEPHYARHPADRQEWSRRRRATDRQAAARRRGAIVIFACDSRATRRGPRGVGGGRRGQLREHNEDAPALRRSFFQAGHAGSIPVTRSHRDVQVSHHSPGVNLRRFSPLDHPRAIRAATHPDGVLSSWDTSAWVNIPGSTTSATPSCSIRTQAWPNFVMRMPSSLSSVWALPDGVTIRRGVPVEAQALAQLHLDDGDDDLRD